MKKAAEYIILPVLALGLLAGCAAGQRRDEIKKPEPPAPVEAPAPVAETEVAVEVEVTTEA